MRCSLSKTQNIGGMVLNYSSDRTFLKKNLNATKNEEGFLEILSLILFKSHLIILESISTKPCLSRVKALFVTTKYKGDEK